jgi:hypothetical protein
MPSSEPQGCLFSFLRLFSGASAPASDQPLPYEIRDDFLSPAELAFYRILAGTVQGRFTICPKVRLADIFYVSRPHENVAARNRIQQKHVDFLLCDPTTLRPRLAIELDDASHQRPDRRDRDLFVDDVFQAAQLPILHIPAARSYSPVALSQQIHSVLG